MRKGIAPVLATVLMVLIAMFLAGGLLIYLSQTQTGITGQASEEQAAITERLEYRYEITSLICGRAAGEDSILIMNSGDAEISSDAITILVNGEPLPAPLTWDAAGGGCSVGSAGKGCLLRGAFPAGVDLDRGDSVSALIGQARVTRMCS